MSASAAATPRKPAPGSRSGTQGWAGFDRLALVVITPTGTGWVDPASMDALEYLNHGDVASVAMQYSYLNSPLSLLLQPEYGAETRGRCSRRSTAIGRRCRGTSGRSCTCTD